MGRGVLNSVARLLRIAIGLAAAAVLLASLAWVFVVRPLRGDELAADGVSLRVLQWGEDREDRIVADLVAAFEQEFPHIRI
jgi:ABC-type glycerol-3-phosphate transport system substrate-binding protein